MRVRAPWLVLAALALAAGCVSETKLFPLPEAPTTRSGAVVAEDQGVRLIANGASWRGNPSDLERAVTPVEVRLENQSGRPLRIDSKDFVLVGSSRFQYAALSPYEWRAEGGAVGGSGPVQGQTSLSVGVGVGGPWGWWGPPGPFIPGYAWRPGWGSGWYSPWWYDPWYGPWYDPFYGPYSSWYWSPPEPLPTRDMLRKALPEGTLEDGGIITGFLYFQSVGEREGRVTLQAKLVDARTGEQFGTLSLPFAVHS